MSFPNSISSFRAWVRDENDKPPASGFALFRRRNRVAPAPMLSRATAPRRPLATINPAYANSGHDRLLLLANVAHAMELLELQQEEV